MPVPRLAEMTWKEVDALDRGRAVLILPTGAVEAHGPHLPLATDDIIALAMAEEGARRLARRQLVPVLLPALSYTAASFAAAFPGTVGLRRETAAAVVADIGRAFAGHGFCTLAIANAHLDPDHLGSLHDALKELRQVPGLAVAFPDLTAKPWALRLTDEFKSGACHAGRYEGSVVLANRPELVRRDVARGLRPNPASLSVAIREGKRTFAEAGGPEAYFGDPAAASAAEGHETIATLGAILEQAVLEAIAGAETSA